MTEEEHARRNAAMERAATQPIPPELANRIAREIEPHTMNAGIPHGEVMIGIELAYPLILDYLRDTPSTST